MLLVHLLFTGYGIFLIATTAVVMEMLVNEWSNQSMIFSDEKAGKKCRKFTNKQTCIPILILII